jgi:hypothetical protein
MDARRKSNLALNAIAVETRAPYSLLAVDRTVALDGDALKVQHWNRHLQASVAFCGGI